MTQFDKVFDSFRNAFREIDEENAPFRQRAGDGWEGELGGWVPVQGDGFIDGHPWYFRARGDSWSLSIAEHNDESAINVRWNKAPGWYFEENYGAWPEAGWMPYKEAWEFIEQSFAKYRNGEGYFSQPPVGERIELL